MSMKFNQGGYNPATSDIGVQFNDKFWSKVAVKEAKRKRFFSQLGDKITQPKNYGDKIVKYHELPIIDEANVNDQGIDANGAILLKNTYYLYDANGDPFVTNADVTTGGGTNNGYSTKELAMANLPVGGSIKSGNGNLYGGDTDFSVVGGSFPDLREEGGIVNAVGMKRETIEAQVTEFGFHVPFTKKMLEMDTEKGLLARISREVGEAQGTLREMQIMHGLMTEAQTNALYTGDATSIATVSETSTLEFTDIRGVEQQLKRDRSPKQTKIITGSDKVDTKVVGSSYVAYVGQELYPTLQDMQHMSVSVWKPIESYAASGMIMEGEIGMISHTRFIEVEDMISYKGQGADATDGTDTTPADGIEDAGANFQITNGKYDVYPVLYVGTDSFATVGFAGDVARVNTVMPKADAHNDAFGKKGLVAISWYFGLMVYRPERIKMLLTAAKVV